MAQKKILFLEQPDKYSSILFSWNLLEVQPLRPFIRNMLETEVRIAWDHQRTRRGAFQSAWEIEQGMYSTAARSHGDRSPLQNLITSLKIHRLATFRLIKLGSLLKNRINDFLSYVSYYYRSSTYGKGKQRRGPLHGERSTKTEVIYAAGEKSASSQCVCAL